MLYPTIDYLPDLTAEQMDGAGSIYFQSKSENLNSATVSGTDQYAILHSIYSFTARTDSTYTIYSSSFFDPFLLRVYDDLGNTLAHNDEDSEVGFYGADIIYKWKPPYEGRFYVDANWDQGEYHTFYYLNIDENISPSQVTTATPVSHNVELAKSIYFNEAEYVEGKLLSLQFNGESFSSTAEVYAAIEGGGMTPWEHFAKYGAYELAADGNLGINPSKQFDISEYYLDKLEQLGQSYTTSALWDIVQIFKENGLDPVSHYALYGEDEGVKPVGVPDGEYIA